MTVATELAKRASTLEYFLAIEGVGWPAATVNGEVGALDASTWQGRVFATSNNSGDLATQLGCSVSLGLQLPSGFSETFDPEAYELTAGGQSYTIIDVDDVLSTTFRQHERTSQSGTEKAATVETSFHFHATTLRLQYTNPGGSVDPQEEGEVAWVGGAEAVLLGARTALGGDAYSYASCTRGYLGTPRGAEDRMGYADTNYAGAFAGGTAVMPWNQYWQGRRTMLVVRVPGTAEFAALAHGFFNRITKQRYGTEWALATTARVTPVRMRRKPQPFRNKAPTAGDVTGLGGYSISGLSSHMGEFLSPKLISGLSEAAHVRIILKTQALTELGFFYAYRTMPGGTKGASAYGVTVAPQAETTTYTDEYDLDSTRYLSGRPVKIGGNVTRLLFKSPDTSGATVFDTRHFVVMKKCTELGGDEWTMLDGEDNEVRLLLDNWSPVPRLNAFTVNNIITKNPIDFALTLLTSKDGEFFRADAAAAGTTTTVNFTAPSWTTDEWEGYALHCVEGTNKGEARVITGNDSDTITVDKAFTASTHSGNEYQIRNTIYDTLPYGFGMQIAWQEMDIDSWEEVRDAYGDSWEIGTVVLGLDNDEDLWALLSEQVFRLFGCMPYVDRATGKLALRYIPQTYTDGVVETYPAVAANDILKGAFETIEMTPRADISRFILHYRGQMVTAAIPIMGRLNPWSRPPEYGIVRWQPLAFVDDREAESSMTVVLTELERTLRGTGREQTIDAMLCGEAQRDSLARILELRLLENAIAKPEADLPLGLRLMTDIYAGGVIAVTTGSIEGVIDPYTGTSGLTAHLCRVLSVASSLREGALRLRVQLLGESGLVVGLVAPAVTVTAKGSAPNRFVVSPDVFAIVRGERDWDEMVVGDLLELRSQTGALVEGPFTITSFGANLSSTPGGASTDVINVTEAIAATIAAGDYVTFIPWASTATVNMERFAAYADATDQELGSGDSPKVYG